MRRTGTYRGEGNLELHGNKEINIEINDITILCDEYKANIIIKCTDDYYHKIKEGDLFRMFFTIENVAFWLYSIRLIEKYEDFIGNKVIDLQCNFNSRDVGAFRIFED